MQNNSINQKQFADEFFSRNRVSISTSKEILRDEFKDSLREKLQVLHLANISKMETSNSFMNKINQFFSKPVLAVGGVFSLIAVSAVLVLLNTGNSPVLTPKTIGANIAFTQGNVEYKKEDGGWYTATSEISLAEGDSVRILKEGKAIINLDDGSAIRLDSDSAITLSSLNPKSIQISNDSGEVYTRVAKADRTFSVLVDGTEFQSMGTAYSTINNEDKKGVRVYQSKVKVSKTNSTESIVVEEGNKYFTKVDANKDLENKVLKSSSEEIKNDKFAKWNKEQDEKVTEFKESLGVLAELDAPEIVIVSPANDSKTTDSPIKVEGTVSSTGATIKINGEVVDNNDGKFVKEVSLNMGENVITIKATMDNGAETVKTIKVIKEEKVEEPTPTPTPTPVPTTKSGIVLKGSKTSNGFSLNWSVSNVDAPMGFKVVWSTSTKAPVYPGNEYQYLSDPSQRSTTIEMKDGKTYNFRVCQYLGGKCGVYSNTVTLTAPSESKADDESDSDKTVTSISLVSNGGGNVSWSVNGFSGMGYKVVYSKNTSPVYPSRSGDYYNYLTNPESKSSTIEAKDGAGTYYVRVCEYLGGKCGKYSNQISVSL